MTNVRSAQATQDPGATGRVQEGQLHKGHLFKGRRGAVVNVAPDQGLLAPMQPVVDPLPSQRPPQPPRGGQGEQRPASGDAGSQGH